MRSAVGVPGPNRRPIPRSCRASMSSFGMIPPPVIRMSSRPCSLEQFADAREERHVRAAQDRQADDVDVFLHGGGRDHLRRLMQSGINDFHARVAERGGDDLRAAIVTVEAGLGNEYSNWTHNRYKATQGGEREATDDAFRIGALLPCNERASRSIVATALAAKSRRTPLRRSARPPRTARRGASACRAECGARARRRPTARSTSV